MIIIDKEKCLWCGTCVGVCPVLAMTLKETYVDVDQERCTSCGICVKACPVGAITMTEGSE
ncbi:MAG: 4Fe-4S binding protein [Thermoplasmata archaeon]|nr:4Fe-4S binding protein [Thermoplasmata archaeon]